MSENQEAIAEPNQRDDGAVSARSPVKAVLLTCLMTGLGHIYCGELVIGLAWATVGALGGVVSLWALANQDAGIGAASLPMWIVSIAAAVHVWSTAKNCPRDYRLKSYNRWYVYVLLLIIGSVGGVGHGLIVKSRFVEAFVTPVSDMHPTLQRGDRFLVDKTAFDDSPVSIDDIVVFKSPEYPKKSFVKRVVAVAGDTVEIRDGRLLVNDRQRGEADPTADDFGPQVVPRYNCFVLGDNRGRSKDSRHFGPVPYAAVVGKAVTIFWPQESWYRFGRID